MAAAREALGDDEWRALWADGATIGSERAVELALDPVEQRDAVSGRLVADVVDESREPVDGEQVTAHTTRQQPAGDREVLVRGLSHHGVARRHVCSGRRAHRAQRPSAISGKTRR
jgi:hypothetical protein